MKRSILLLLALTLALSMGACGAKDNISESDIQISDTYDDTSDTYTDETVLSDSDTDADETASLSTDTSLPESDISTPASGTNNTTSAETTLERVTEVPKEAVNVVGSEVAEEINDIASLGGADGILNGITDVIYSSLSDEEKKEFIEMAANEGAEVTFGDDGTTTFLYGDGVTAVQRPDGTYTVKGADGSEGQIGGKWPQNDYTKLIPEPEKGTLLISTVEDSEFIAMYTDSTIYYAVTYADLLKEKGFDKNAVADDSMFDDGVFSYYAENKKGVSVSISYISDTFVITVKK